MQLFSFDFSIPILLAAFSLCTSMLAVLGTVQLVAPQSSAHAHQHRPDVEVGLVVPKRNVSWWGSIASAESRFVPLESQPPLSMAKLIMLRHAETQRRANNRARMRLARQFLAR